MKAVTIFLYAVLALVALNTLNAFSLQVGVPIFAIVLAICYFAVLSFFVLRLLRKNKTSDAPIVKKLLEYVPFVILTSFVLRRLGSNPSNFAFDVYAIICWLLLCVATIITLYLMNDKRTPFILPKSTKKTLAKRFVTEILSWIDAFVQAAFLITLVNIFVFQLYAIPSESMVPQFLIGDRVLSPKFNASPTFPLTDVSLPRLKNYKRGDIVVFKNPHYDTGKQSEIKSFLNQLVYMLTFTALNINVDENGNPIADPLVKRVTGEPGEQLVMVDGVLYARTKDNSVFTPVQADSTWATWNLNTLSSELKQKVRDFPLSQKHYDVLLDVENERKNLSMIEAQNECKQIVQIFNSAYDAINLQKTLQSAQNINLSEHTIYTFTRDIDSIVRTLLTSSNGKDWFNHFMTDWAQNIAHFETHASNDPYEDAMFRLNALIKRNLGMQMLSIVMQTLPQNFNAQVDVNGAILQEALTKRDDLLKQAEKYWIYLIFNDSRNMCVFPQNNQDGSPSYIPQDCYFMMGDNRFNSLDMRHTYDATRTKITNYDNYSLCYDSRMSPRYVSAKKILGTSYLRFWPLNRFGLTQVKDSKK